MPSGGLVGAIPARFASSRLPGKPLLPIAGKPMIEHVYRRVATVDALDRVVVLTDDERIVDAVEGFGGEALMTPVDCPSGTDRIAFAARTWDCHAVINVQGDEPLIDPNAVSRLARLMKGNPSVEMATLAAPLDPDRFSDPNAVKVVTALDGTALYFSRAPIPHDRDGSGHAVEPRLHLGLYGYRRDVLLRLAELEPTPLERSESLEQLRALEHGIKLQVITLDAAAEPGVDTREDLERTALRLAEAAEDTP
ncbi:MAG: 3-deoxy-manno-octulosonate cytidylyltransferase [Acidobacteriota bacterium]